MTMLTIDSPLTTQFTTSYEVTEADIRRLYENAKRDQWNASRDIPWSAPQTDDGRVIADELIDIYGSPLWERLSETDRVFLNRRIAVMDSTAVTLCMENNLPILVLNLWDPDALVAALKGEEVGTLVHD